MKEDEENEKATALSAGIMVTALTFSLAEKGHEVRLVARI